MTTTHAFAPPKPVAGFYDATTLSLRPLPKSLPSDAEILAVVCITHVCVGFAMGSVSPAMEPVTASFHLSDSWRGILGAASLAGNIAGSPMGGSIADLWGRRTCLLIAWAVLMCSLALQGLSFSIQQLCLARAMVGWAVGAHYSGITAYLSECLTTDKVESMMSLTELHFFIGNFLSIAIGAMFKYSIHDSDLRWRLTLALPGIPLLFTISWFFLKAPESESWKKSEVNEDQGQDIEYIEPPYPQDPTNETFYSAIANTQNDATNPSLSDHGRDLFFCSLFWASLVVPTYAVSAFAVTIIEDLHTSADPFVINTLLGAAIMVGVVAGCYLVPHFGKKTTLLLSQWGVALVFGLMALVKPYLIDDLGASRGWLVSVIIILFLAFEILNGFGAPLSLVYPAEIFPPNIKGIASGLSAMNSRIMAVAAIFSMSFALSRIGVAGTLGAIGVFSGICALATHRLAPQGSTN